MRHERVTVTRNEKCIKKKYAASKINIQKLFIILIFVHIFLMHNLPFLIRPPSQNLYKY
jgi:hypothetical protein